MRSAVGRLLVLLPSSCSGYLVAPLPIHHHPVAVARSSTLTTTTTASSSCRYCARSNHITMAASPPPPPLTDAEIVKIFSEFDADGNGFIDGADLAALLGCWS